jgi:hypothetical protein
MVIEVKICKFYDGHHTKDHVRNVGISKTTFPHDTMYTIYVPLFVSIMSTTEKFKGDIV